jgi:superkiller protein 3
MDPGNADYETCLANALRKDGKMDEALIYYKNAAEIKTDSPEAQYNFGQALKREGKTEEAMSRFQIALQIEPNYMPARWNLGFILFQEGKIDEAAAQFRKVLESNPNYPDTHLYLGLCLFQLGRMAEAKSQYEQALEINSFNPQIQNNLAWLLAACPVASLRDGNEAVELARESNEITGGTDPAILHTLAAAQAQDGRYSEAVQTAQQALSLAEVQTNSALAKQLQDELKFYSAGKSLPATDKAASN